MFETSVVRDRVAPSARVRVFLYSLVAHTAVVLGVVGVSIASVEFPSNAPDEYRTAPSFRPVQVPPPLGNPNGGARRAEAATPRPAAAPAQVTAPRDVPDLTPVAEAAVPGPSTGAGDATGPGTEPGPVGQPWGVDGGVGDLDAPPSDMPAQPAQIYVIGGEVKAPVLVHRVDPDYPDILRRTRMAATVVVRCVIDRNGNVRDPQIVKGALPPFNAAVIEAVQQWRFRPGSLRGEAVETYLDLTVRFAVN